MQEKDKALLMEGLIRSPAWALLTEEINKRLSNAQVKMESAKLDDVQELQGEIKAFRTILNLPSVLIQMGEEIK